MQRTIKPEEFITKNNFVVLDVRRDDDYQKSEEIIPGSTWKDPTKIDQWIESIPKNEKIVIYCVRGGGVSNSVIDRLHAEGLNAQYIEGGIESLKEAGGMIEKR
jgi:rhodanese-related sulfurtransferase